MEMYEGWLLCSWMEHTKLKIHINPSHTLLIWSQKNIDIGISLDIWWFLFEILLCGIYLVVALLWKKSSFDCWAHIPTPYMGNM